MGPAVGCLRCRQRFSSSERKYGIRAGSINPNLFQDQAYKYGSICSPDPAVREKATLHMLDCVEIAKRLDARDIAPWVSDGSNYPGTQSIRKRIGWMEEAFSRVHAALAPTQRLLIEYKPFEPAFYHTDIADWGMALELARSAGPQAYVLVDTGHHYQGQNIEQIVAWLLHTRAAGRLPLQRSPLRRRRPHTRLDRSVSGLPYLPRNPQLSGDSQWQRTRP